MYATSNDLTLDFSTGHIEIRERSRLNWNVHLFDTGLSTMTGGRVKRSQSLIGDETFMCTCGDGLASIDVAEVLRFHKAARRAATVTVVRPPAGFGTLDIDGDRVARFIENPQTSEGWINGNFKERAQSRSPRRRVKLRIHPWHTPIA